MLIAIALASGALSAIFVNDTVCLVLAPLVAEITRALKRNPVPYLLAVAMASNIGSVATLTGNPQNMLIGTFSAISYAAFARALAPVAVVGLVICVAILALLYRTEFRGHVSVTIDAPPVQIDRVLMFKSLTVALAMMIFFFAGWPLAEVAIVSARSAADHTPHLARRYLRAGGLGIAGDVRRIVHRRHRFQKSFLEQDLAVWASKARLDNGMVISAISAFLSNIVSNVPAVLVFKPFIAAPGRSQLGWLRLAMATTLAGNLTILGSVANLIVVERSREMLDRPIGFWEYARAGVPIGILTIAVGVWLL